MKIIKQAALALLVVLLVVIAFTGMAIGMLASMHWHLPASGSGGLAVIGGFVAQIIAVLAMFALGESDNGSVYG